MIYNIKIESNILFGNSTVEPMTFKPRDPPSNLWTEVLTQGAQRKSRTLSVLLRGSCELRGVGPFHSSHIFTLCVLDADVVGYHGLGCFPTHLVQISLGSFLHALAISILMSPYLLLHYVRKEDPIKSLL